MLGLGLIRVRLRARVDDLVTVRARRGTVRARVRVRVRALVHARHRVRHLQPLHMDGPIAQHLVDRRATEDEHERLA